MSVASLMNTTVTIEAEATVKNSSGLNTRTWSTATTLPARAEDLTGAERITYGRLGYEATKAFYFATDPDLSDNEAARRIVWSGNAYYIVEVLNQGGNLNRVWKVVAQKKPLGYSTNG